MANPEVKVTLTLVDKLSAGLKKTQTGIQGVFGGFTELSSALGLAERGFSMVKGVIDEVIGSTIEYGKQVDDLSRALGTSTEEASKLIQISDDLRIPIEQLQLAFRNALNKGVNPSIDGLKDLAAEYQQIEDPVQRAQFAMEKFGARAGLQMQKVLELTTGQIDEMAASAERAGLVMSREGVEATKKYWQELDNLQDSIQGVKIGIGQQLIPELAKLAEWLNKNFTADSLLRGALEKNIITYKEFRLWSGKVMTGQMELADVEALVNQRTEEHNATMASSATHWLPAMRAAAIGAAEGVTELGDSEEEAAKKAEELRERINQMADDAIVSMRELKQQRIEDFFDVDIDPAAIAAQLFDVVAFKEAGGQALNAVVEQIKAGIAEGKITPDEAQELFANVAAEGEAIKVNLGDISLEDAAAEISQNFNIPLEDAKARLDAALAGIDLINNADISKIIANFDALQARKDMLIEAGEIPITADPGGIAMTTLVNLETKLIDITTKDWTINVKVNQQGSPKPPASPGPGGQHGLNMVIPPGFPNDTFPLRASSGEHVLITPQGAGGAGVVNNIVQNFYDEGAAALGMATVRQMSRDRLNASMGR